MRVLCTFLLACFTALGSIQIPSTAVTLSTNSYTNSGTELSAEFRVHGSLGTGPIATIGGYGISITSGSILNFNIADSTNPTTGNVAVVIPSGITDLTIGITRLITGVNPYFADGAIFISVRNTLNGQQIFSELILTITSKATNSAIVNNGISIGGTSAPSGEFIDFIRGYYAYHDPANAVIPFINSASPAPWVDYEFAASGTVGNDTSGNGQNLTGLATACGGNCYSAVPTYTTPVCNAGRGTILTGTTLTSSGINSYALNGNYALSYSWTYVGAGADGVTQPGLSLTGTTTATPTASPITNFGSIDLALTVTDSGSNQTSCTGYYGAVVANPTTYLINESAEGLTSVQKSLIGPQIAMGHNQWPFADQAIEISLNLQACQIANSCTINGTTQGLGLYSSFWRNGIIAGSTATITGGSDMVTLTADPRPVYCNGTTTGDGVTQFEWRNIGTDGLTHYLTFGVLTCSSTQIEIAYNGSPFTYPTSPNSLNNSSIPGQAVWPTCSPCSGQTYGAYSNASTQFAYYLNPNSPYNYYDVLFGALTSYWRSGRDDYFSLAQSLATYALECPITDYFNICTETNNYNPGNPQCTEVKNVPLDGLALWEQRSGNSTTVLPALENLGWFYQWQLASESTQGFCDDLRGCAYMTDGVGVMSLIETNPTFKSNYWQHGVENALTNLWTPSIISAPYIGIGNVFYAGKSSISLYGGSGSITASTVTTSILQGVGTSFTSGDIGNQIWTFAAPASTQPVFCGTCSTSGWVVNGDSQMYVITGVNSGTQQVSITPNYLGTTNLVGRGFAEDTSSPIAGYGFQPYMMTLFGIGMYRDYLSMVDCGSPCSSYAALYLSYGHITANLMPSITTPDNGGYYNGIWFPGCTPPFNIPSSTNNPQYGCYGLAGAAGPSTSVGTRQLATEAMRLFAYDQLYFPGANISYATGLMSQLFSKPGVTNSVGSQSDGSYLYNYDITAPAILLPFGFYVYPPNFSNSIHKWTGQLLGFGGGVSSIPGVLAQQATLPNLTITGPIKFSGPMVLQ